MAGIIETEYGRITISEELVATLAGYAAGDNFGIVAMTGKTAGDALLKLVGGTNHKRGVKVTTVDDGKAMVIDMYVNMAYGVSMPAVAKNAMDGVRYRVEEATGLKVKAEDFKQIRTLKDVTDVVEKLVNEQGA